MIRLLTILLFSISILLRGQAICSPTAAPQEVFYPNTVTSSTIGGLQYLCGPNTVAYDTTYRLAFIQAYINPNTTLTIRAANPGYHSIWIKNNGTLNVLQGTSGTINIYLETGAIINNPFSVITATYLCSPIVYPLVNCIVTSLQEIDYSNCGVSIYPNPTTDIINIKTEKTIPKTIEIKNVTGKIILSISNVSQESLKINVKDFVQGIYCIKMSFADKNISRYFIKN